MLLDLFTFQYKLEIWILLRNFQDVQNSRPNKTHLWATYRVHAVSSPEGGQTTYPSGILHRYCSKPSLVKNHTAVIARTFSLSGAATSPEAIFCNGGTLLCRHQSEDNIALPFHKGGRPKIIEARPRTSSRCCFGFSLEHQQLGEPRPLRYVA